MKENKLLPLILVTSLFFLWALTSNLIPTLIPHLKKACRLTDFQSAFIDSAYWIAYFVIALPAGLVMQKLGYKKAIIIGLLIAAVGAFLFYPAAEQRTFAFFLVALFIVASGMAFLETAANPYMTILGPAETASQRLNFAQAFNGLGAFIAAFFLSKIILSGKEISEIMLSKLSASEANSLLTQEAKSLQTPYIIIGLVLLFVAVLFMVVRFPEEKKQVRTDIPDSGTFNLFKHKNVLLGIAAQFFYVGAQVCISSFFIRYAKFSAGLEELEAATYLGFLLMGFMIGRYAGTFLMQYIKPEKLLMYYSIASILLLAMVVFLGGKFSLYALIGVEFFMSIMFPTIFSLAIGGLGVKTKIASSYIVMSIVGGAFLPVIMGKISDLFNIQLAYLIPAISFFVVLYFSIKVKPIHEPVKEI